MTTTEIIDLLVTLQTGHPLDVNPLLPKFHYLQSKFSDYVDSCLYGEDGPLRDVKTLTELEVREIAENFLQDHDIEIED